MTDYNSHINEWRILNHQEKWSARKIAKKYSCTHKKVSSLFAKHNIKLIQYHNNKFINLEGNKFGALTVLKLSGKDDKGVLFWECVCDCNPDEIYVANGDNLKRNRKTNCGCKHANKEDLAAQRFGRLVVKKDSQVRKNGSVLWECICDCGNHKIVSAANLRKKKVRSCSCIKSEDIVGQEFSLLTVISLTEKKYHGFKVWLCECNCGNMKEVPTSRLVGGQTRSCGCLADAESLIGNIYNKWTVLEYGARRESNNEILWRCRCECANISLVSRDHLRTGHSRGCRECSPLKGEDHPMWKNGVSLLNKYLRQRLKKWKEDSFEKYGYSCYASGNKEDLEIHHLNKPFYQIVDEAIVLTNVEIGNNISSIPPEKLEKLTKYVIDLHYKYGLGIPLNRKLHKEIHNKYGNDVSKEEFQEFLNHLKT